MPDPTEAQQFTRAIASGGYFQKRLADTKWGQPSPLSRANVDAALKIVYHDRHGPESHFAQRFTMRLHGPTTDQVVFSGSVTFRDDGYDVSFADKSSYLLDSTAPADAGPALMEPLTRRETAAVEPLLQVLWKAIEHQSLSATQRTQIVAMAELIKAEQLAAVPGETPRWKLVGTVRASLRYLAKDVPKDALAWWKLVELLEQIDWTTIAGELPGL